MTDAFQGEETLFLSVSHSRPKLDSRIRNSIAFPSHVVRTGTVPCFAEIAKQTDGGSSRLLIQQCSQAVLHLVVCCVGCGSGTQGSSCDPYLSTPRLALANVVAVAQVPPRRTRERDPGFKSSAKHWETPARAPLTAWSMPPHFAAFSRDAVVPVRGCY